MSYLGSDNKFPTKYFVFYLHAIDSGQPPLSVFMTAPSKVNFETPIDDQLVESYKGREAPFLHAKLTSVKNVPNTVG